MDQFFKKGFFLGYNVELCFGCLNSRFGEISISPAYSRGVTGKARPPESDTIVVPTRNNKDEAPLHVPNLQYRRSWVEKARTPANVKMALIPPSGS